MRILIPLTLLAGPAMAHPGAGPHLHETHGLWAAALAFAVGLTLSSVALLRGLRGRA